MHFSACWSSLKALVKDQAYKQPGVQWLLQKIISSVVGVISFKDSSSFCFHFRPSAVHISWCSSLGGIPSFPTLRGIVVACWDCILYFSSNSFFVSVKLSKLTFLAFDSLWIVPYPLHFHPPTFLAIFSISVLSQLSPGNLLPFSGINSFPLISFFGALFLAFSYQDYSSILNILTWLFSTLKIFSHHHSPFWSKLIKFKIKINKKIQDTSTMLEDPLDRVVTNNSYILCKVHYFMISRFIKRFNELKAEVQWENKSKKKKLEN